MKNDSPARFLFGAVKAKNVGGPVSKLLLVVLADMADKNGQSHPSIEYLADRCECKTRTVINKLDQLEAGGWIKRQRRTSNGIKTSNLYTVCDVKEIHNDVNEIHNDVKEIQEGGETDSPGGSERDSHKTPTLFKLPIETPSSDTCVSATGAANSVDNSLQALKRDYRDPSAGELMFRRGVWLLSQYGIQEAPARNFLGMCKQQYGAGQTVDAVLVACVAPPEGCVKAWIQGILKNQPKPIDPGWQSEPDQVAELERQGIPAQFIHDARDTFVTWFRGMEVSHSDWPGLFREWVIRDWDHHDFQAFQSKRRLAERSGFDLHHTMQGMP